MEATYLFIKPRTQYSVDGFKNQGEIDDFTGKFYKEMCNCYGSFYFAEIYYCMITAENSTSYEIWKNMKLSPMRRYTYNGLNTDEIVNRIIADIAKEYR